MLLVWVTVLFIVSISVGQVSAQTSGAPNCALFTAMSDEHGKKAQAIEQDAAERAKSLTGDAAATNADIAARAAKSEWEVAALSREAARKCLQDFISGGQTTAAAPLTTTPVQAAPVVIQQPAPVVARQSAPVVVRQPVPVVVEQVVPVPQFHSTPVSAIAVGGAALAAPRILGGGSGQGFQAGNNPPGGLSPIRSVVKNPDGSERGFERSHSQSTSAVTSTTTNVTKSPGGGMATNSQIVRRNLDGTVDKSNIITSRTRPGGPLTVQGVGTSQTGVKTEYQGRHFQNFTLEGLTTTNPDGTVSKQIQRINNKTGAVTVVPNTPPQVSAGTPPSTSGRPTAPPRPIGQRMIK